MAGVEARERINLFRAAANAVACSFAKKEDPMLPSLRADLVEAYFAAPDPATPRPLIQVVSR